MKLINPCRTCLIKACCTLRCEEKQLFIDLMKKLDPFIKVIFASITIISVTLLITFISNLNFNLIGRFYILIVSLWFVPFLILFTIIFKEILHDLAEGEDFSLIVAVVLLMIVLAPFFSIYLILIKIYHQIFGHSLM